MHVPESFETRQTSVVVVDQTTATTATTTSDNFDHNTIDEISSEKVSQHFDENAKDLSVENEKLSEISSLHLQTTSTSSPTLLSSTLVPTEEEKKTSGHDHKPEDEDDETEVVDNRSGESFDRVTKVHRDGDDEVVVNSMLRQQGDNTVIICQ